MLAMACLVLLKLVALAQACLSLVNSGEPGRMRRRERISEGCPRDFRAWWVTLSLSSTPGLDEVMRGC